MTKSTKNTPAKIETVRLYKITCHQGMSIHEEGYWYSLLPWSGDNRDYQGEDDGGKYYALPSGYVVEETSEGLVIYHDSDLCQIVEHSSGKPQLVGGGHEMPVLALIDRFEKRAGDLTGIEQEVFVEAFYQLCPVDDVVDGNPNPWGCPWHYSEDTIFEGTSIEDMAKEYYEEVESEIKDCLEKEEKERAYNEDDDDE